MSSLCLWCGFVCFCSCNKGLVALWYSGSVYQNCCFSDGQKAFYGNCFNKLVSCWNANLGPVCFLLWISVLFYFEETNRSIFFSDFQKQPFDLFFLAFLYRCGHYCYLAASKKKKSHWSVCLWNNNCTLLFCSNYRIVLISEWRVRCYHNVSDMIISKDSSVLVMHKCMFTG